MSSVLRAPRWIWVGVILWGGVAGAQAPDDRLRLLQADVLSTAQENGQRVKRVVGHVVFRQGRTLLRCDRVTEYMGTGEVVFEGGVRVTRADRELRTERLSYDSAERLFRSDVPLTLIRGGVRLTADRGWYLPDQDRLHCSGGVVFRDSVRTVTGDRATYAEAESLLTMAGSVIIRNDSARTEVRGDSAVFDQRTARIRVFGDPELVLHGDDGAPRLTALGRTMELFEDSSRVVIVDSVRIQRANQTAEADRAVYERTGDGEQLHLTGTPRIRQGRNRIRAAAITVHLAGNSAHRVDAVGGARATMPAGADSERWNVLLGSQITMYLEQNQTRRMEAVRNAESTYYVVEQGRSEGANHVRGERITIEFREGRPDRVTVFGAGTGTFFPPTLVDQMEKR